MRRADIEVPNLPVDVDSWGRSACYPRGSFYPLSDGPPTRYHRITKPDFRPCSTCRSRSQAPFCLCTLRTISDRSEGTFGRLRYFFRRRPPQSNCPPNNVQSPDSWRPVRTPVLSGWYPKDDSTKADALVSQSPPYPVQTIPELNAKLQ